MSELEPCPFCGGEAELKRYQSGDWQVICYHTDGCIMLESDLDNCYWENVQTLARQWNTRHQCGLADEDYNILLDELGVSERTCEIEHVKGGARYDVWRCSACGYEYAESVSETSVVRNYCPNCGAKVVSE